MNVQHRINAGARRSFAATSRQNKSGIYEDLPREPSANDPSSSRSSTSSRPHRLILPPSPNLIRTADWKEDDDYESYVDHPLLYDPSTTKQLHLHTLPKQWKNYEIATPLWDHLVALLSVTGRPISFATYMNLCLTHPQYGYYTTNNQNNPDDHSPDDDDDDDDDFFTNTRNDDSRLDDYMIGRDFVTAPEISQVFGECLAVWFRTQWDRNNQQLKNHTTKHHPWQFIECGPGKGSLMVDFINASFQLEYGMYCDAIHFIEASPVLRSVQRETLQLQLSHLVRLDFVVTTTTNDPSHDNDNDRPPTQQPQQQSMKPKYDNTIQVHWHDSFLDFVMWEGQRRQQASSSSSSSNDSDDGSSDNTLPLLNFVVCQEFVDALPIYSFQKTTEGWRERLIDLAIADEYYSSLEHGDNSTTNSTTDPPKTAATTTTTASPAESNSNDIQSTRLDTMKKPRLRVVLAPEVTPPTKTLLQVDDNGFMRNEDPTTNIGSIVEINPEGLLLMQDITNLLSETGGAALIIDYGHEGSTDSIRGYYRHEQVPFLSLPGQVDVTADVDFSALAHAVNHRSHTAAATGTTNNNGLTTQAYGPVTQGEFLMSMGLQERVLSVIEHEHTTDQDAENLYQAMVRLASPEEMGERFKVLAIVKNHDTSFQPPPGFEQAAHTY